MSKINQSLYTSISHLWQTPPDILEAILAFEGIDAFSLDPCCTQKNVPARRHFTSDRYDGLKESWDTETNPIVFLNPPYGNVLRTWLEKAYTESLNGVRSWVLIPARTETVYQHQHGLSVAGFVAFLKGRLKFWLNGEPYLQLDKTSGKMRQGNAPFPAMLLYYGQDAPEKATRWQEEQPLKSTVMRRVQ